MKKILLIAFAAGSFMAASAQVIENHSHSTVGYVKSDGTVENSSHSTIGYIKDDGTVENSSHSTIGYAKGIAKEWVAVAFFFFKFD